MLMSTIKKLDLSSKTIKGLSVRTKNSDEVDTSSQKIAPLWRRFESEVLPLLDQGAEVYAVYSEYENDASGDYTLLIGSDSVDSPEEMSSVSIQEGRYLMFPVKGELPEAILKTWQEIWHYFQDPSVDERRDFKTDFERYKASGEVEIYIGVNYF